MATKGTPSTGDGYTRGKKIGSAQMDVKSSSGRSMPRKGLFGGSGRPGPKPVAAAKPARPQVTSEPHSWFGSIFKQK